MVLVTRRLEPAEVHQQVDFIAEFLASRSVADIEVMYGWGCNLNTEELWQPETIPAGSLAESIRQSCERGVLPIAEGDVFIKVPPLGFEFRLCHESDVHFTSDHADLVATVRDHWSESGFGPQEAHS